MIFFQKGVILLLTNFIEIFYFKTGEKMSSYTVNGLLTIQKSLRTRLSQLNEVKNESTHRNIYRMAGQDKIEEPTYDIKKVDAKIVEINRALTNIDMKVKESNAITKVAIDLNLDSLTAPLE